MSYDPVKHHRRSLRLKGFDYSSGGAYFVSVCVHRRESLFGEIVGEEMRLNEAGRRVEQWWKELTNKYPTVATDEHIVMPNHLHGIVIITENNRNSDVGATLRGRPKSHIDIDSHDQTGHPHRGAPTLGDIVGWFKTMTTNAYIRGVTEGGWPPFPGRLWQRGYYEHVVRDEGELNALREYIALNPTKGTLDDHNPVAKQRPKTEATWYV